MSCLVLQREKLMAAGVVADRIYSDTLQKNRDTRNGLRNCLKALRSQSTLIVLTLDRLGDHTLGIVELGDVLLRREAGLNVLSGIGSDLDFTSESGRKALEAWALLSDFQKECRRDKILKGLTELRARGIIAVRVSNCPRNRSYEHKRLWPVEKSLSNNFAKNSELEL